MKHLQMLILPLLITCKFISRSSGEPVYVDRTLEGSDMTDFPDGEYENVKTINFHNNNFNELKSFIFQEHKLLKVDGATIRHSNIRYIHPYAFAKMSNLLDLSLYGNNLTTFRKDTFVGLESLQHLDLGHNQILLIDALILKPLQSLKTLDLSYNKLPALAPHLLKHSSLSELELSGNLLQFAAEGPIFESNSLTRLVMTFCNITELPSNAFVELLQIRNLDLSNNKLEILPKDLLKPLVYLEHFDVSYNSIRHLGVEMFPSPTNFHTLLCDENPLKLPFLCDDIIKALKNKRDYRSLEEPVRNVTDDKKENGNATAEVDQLVTVLCIFVSLCLFAVGAVGVILYMFWQRREYIPAKKIITC